MKIQVRVGPSRIAGQGLFAAQAITQGTDIIQYTGEKISKAESVRRLTQGNAYIFTFNERWDIDGQVFRNTARYINHSCDPNCEAQKTPRSIWIVALRDITAGEELTYNYSYEIDDEPAQRCRCGATTCCGYMLAPQYWGRIKEYARRW